MVSSFATTEFRMSATGLDAFDKTLQTTFIWLDEIMAALRPDRQVRSKVLSAVPHKLRYRMGAAFVRKVDAPGHPELGIGAVVDGSEPQIVLNKEVGRRLGLPPGDLEAETRRQLGEIEARRRSLGRRAGPITSRTVIVVDDGIATAVSMRFASSLRSLSPRRTRSKRLARRLARSSVSAPQAFLAVGQHHAHFDQTRKLFGSWKRSRALVPSDG